MRWRRRPRRLRRSSPWSPRLPLSVTHKCGRVAEPAAAQLLRRERTAPSPQDGADFSRFRDVAAMAAESGGGHPSSGAPRPEMCCQQTVFDRNVVSCHAAAIGAKIASVPAAPGTGDPQKNYPPRTAVPSSLCDLSRAGARQGIANNEGSHSMPRGCLPGHVPELFASARSAHASHRCLSELALPNIGGGRDLFGRFTPSGEPRANRESAEQV